jgi:hypothetical protein
LNGISLIDCFFFVTLGSFGGHHHQLHAAIRWPLRHLKSDGQHRSMLGGNSERSEALTHQTSIFAALLYKRGALPLLGAQLFVPLVAGSLKLFHLPLQLGDLKH